MLFIVHIILYSIHCNCSTVIAQLFKCIQNRSIILYIAINAMCRHCHRFTFGVYVHLKSPNCLSTAQLTHPFGQYAVLDCFCLQDSIVIVIIIIVIFWHCCYANSEIDSMTLLEYVVMMDDSG